MGRRTLPTLGNAMSEPTNTDDTDTNEHRHVYHSDDIDAPENPTNDEVRKALATLSNAVTNDAQPIVGGQVHANAPPHLDLVYYIGPAAYVADGIANAFDELSTERQHLDRRN